MSRWTGLCGAALATTVFLAPVIAMAATLTVTLDGVANGKAMPGQYAFCVLAQQGHVTLGSDKNPKVSWSGAPKSTRSFAVIVVDPDVPSVPTPTCPRCRPM